MKSNSRTKVLIVDDDLNVRDVIKVHLEINGFDVVSADNGELAIEQAIQVIPDLILLDIMMPVKDGFSTCSELRNMGVDVPVIFLSARNTEDDKIRGFNLGADDYISKPFSMKELLVRINARLGTYRTKNDISEVVFGNCVINFRAHIARYDNKSLELSAREYKLLKYLILKQGSTVSRDELLNEVWGQEKFPSTRTVDNQIARLRQKIESDTNKPKHLITVHGVGYKFVADSFQCKA